ncbi:acyltransferase [Erysiphe pulchra]|uniref:Acyltransferase n=1 Tax=Erysiphe pulchra TaxID=225359 RepID=A0A2S4Q1R4_9PEZI|nr:acyltransferase [Erysiphe pulchra]
MTGSSRTSAPDLDILGDQVTLHPGGYIEPPRSRFDEGNEQNLVENVARFRTSPLEFLREVSLHVSGTGWRAYNNYIGQPIFYTGFTENMVSDVLSTPILRSKISELAEKRVTVEDQEGLLIQDDPLYTTKRSQRKAVIEKSLAELCEKLTFDMLGIHVSSEEVIRLRKVAENAYRAKQSLIFLPSHRSHVDYVSLQLICYRLGIGLPTFVAGDNLNFPVVGGFLQRTGAMWIRRSFGDDVLYSTLVQSYIDTLLQGGYNLSCFIEGSRSRTGKLLPPKFGILRFMLDSIISGRIQDAIICPVSTQYDKVIETEGYVTELLGIPKKKENLADFVSASSVLSLKLGRVDCRFHQPWSLKEFIQEQKARTVSLPKQINDNNDNNNANSATRQRLLRTLGYRVLSDINAVSVVMPTALIGTVLLTLRGRGVGQAELIRRVEWLIERVRFKGGRVAHFGNAQTSTVIERSLDVLGKDLVGTVEGLPEPTYYAVDRFHLSFYRNMTIHLFVTEALVCVSMYTRIKQGGGPDNQKSTYDELKRQVIFLSQLFRAEFIYPTDGLESNLENTLRGLEKDEVVVREFKHNEKFTEVNLTDRERKAGRENFDFYCFLIWPFVESFWLGAVSVMGLTPPLEYQGDGWLSTKKCQDSAQLLGKTLYHQGDLSYFEAVNRQTLKNAWIRLEEEGIILVAKSHDSKIPARAKISPEWQPSRDPETGLVIAKGRLWDFIEKIAQSRREGKNRRDGATVSTRVLRHTENIARSLFMQGDDDLIEKSKFTNPKMALKHTKSPIKSYL